MQNGNDDKETDKDEDKEDASTSWSGGESKKKGSMHAQMAGVVMAGVIQQQDRKEEEDKLFLDTGSYFHLGRSKKLVVNCRKAGRMMEMTTNAGNGLLMKKEICQVQVRCGLTKLQSPTF